MRRGLTLGALLVALLAALPGLADPAANEAARIERLRAAQARQEAARNDQAAGWHVIDRQHRQCRPLAMDVPGATDPADALARIRAVDPDAGFTPDGQWPTTLDLPFAEIETSAGRFMLAQNLAACVNLFRVYRW